VETLGSLWEIADAAVWKDVDTPGEWTAVARTFRDGHSETWWALETVAGPYGPAKPTRAVVATTNPTTLPELSTWYLVTNLPAPQPQPQETIHPVADLAEVVRLYGLRNWVEQSYKQVKQSLGWAQYQVRSDRAIRRHWQLVCCAFSFCWWAAGGEMTKEREASDADTAAPATEQEAGRGGWGRENGNDHRCRGRVQYDGYAHGWNRGRCWDVTGGRGAICPRRPRCSNYLTNSGTVTRWIAMPADNKLPLVCVPSSV